jgi:hypothetical protein
MAMLFAKQWYPILQKLQIPVEWPAHYIPVDPTAMAID